MAMKANAKTRRRSAIGCLWIVLVLNTSHLLLIFINRLLIANTNQPETDCDQCEVEGDNQGFIASILKLDFKPAHLIILPQMGSFVASVKTTHIALK